MNASVAQYLLCANETSNPPIENKPVVNKQVVCVEKFLQPINFIVRWSPSIHSIIIGLFTEPNKAVITP